MKDQKRILVALIALLLTMTILLPCASGESIFSPQASVLIDSSYVDANPMGSGRIDVTASIEANYSADQLGFSYIRLQEYRDGVWTTVKSVPSKYAYNAISYMYSFTYYGTPGMSYRAQAGYYAKDGTVTETRSSTSGTITCN